VKSSAQLMLSTLLLVACSGGSGPPPPIGVSCGVPAGVNVVLLNPAPNSAQNADDFGSITVGSSGKLSNTLQAYVGESTATGTMDSSQTTPSNWRYYGTFEPAPAPSPLPESQSALTYFYTSADPGITWPTKATIYVYLGDQASGCVPTTSLGQFTLQ
jgi:hypothetical protein